MPKRKTLQDVIDRIKELSNDTVKLLSDVYVNNRTKLDLLCKCNRPFSRDFEHINRGQIYCNECMREMMSENFRYDLDHIIKEINKTGCKYISGEYKNNKSLLYIQCRCGNKFYKTWQKFHGGQDRCQKCGLKKSADAKKIYTPTIAAAIFQEYGYTMTGPFIDAHSKTPCKCKNGHDCNLSLSQLLVGKTGCEECAREAHKGEGHWNYKGGISVIDDVIRNKLYEWKKSIRDLYDRKCPITGNTGLNSVVHHLKSLNLIFNEVVSKRGIDISKFYKVNEIKDSSMLDEIVDEIVSCHNNESGILISNEIHIEYHKKYGYGNNTPEQFDEFLFENYNIHLSDILHSQKGV